MLTWAIMKRVLALSFGLLLGLVGAQAFFAAPTHACSCVMGDPWHVRVIDVQGNEEAREFWVGDERFYTGVLYPEGDSLVLDHEDASARLELK